MRRAIIIGGGPAGLTAAYELVTRASVRPLVLEASDMLGGLARTVNYKSNRIDVGGHRFFSKSDRVLEWWFRMLPPERVDGRPLDLRYQGMARAVDASRGADPEATDDVMLVRARRSRIYYLRRFFDYPLTLGWKTIRNLGPARMARIAASYARARLAPIRPERSLEDFLVNRFGRALYETFFRSYTEKVWGVPCREISAAWGAERIKGLSVAKAVLHALGRPFRRPGNGAETSLVESFLYPKYGPGQMWEKCAARVRERGGEIVLRTRVERVLAEPGRVTGVVATGATGGTRTLLGDFVFSTMPVRDLIRGMDGVPPQVREVSEGLLYRDFLTVGLLVGALRVKDPSHNGNRLIRDNWIYVQEPGVKVGRLQIYNNWSPYLVADRSRVWLGLEYFVREGDALWSMRDEDLVAFGADELRRIGILDGAPPLDGTVVRMPKAYPAYFGTYDRFGEVRRFLDGFENLFPVGRNGMHRYNNQDHSMLAAMTAVDNIVAGRADHANVWDAAP